MCRLLFSCGWRTRIDLGKQVAVVLQEARGSRAEFKIGIQTVEDGRFGQAVIVHKLASAGGFVGDPLLQLDHQAGIAA
jgi:hypothetical protein